MLEFDGKKSKNIRIEVAELINIPCPEDDIEEIIIPGRDGALHRDNKRKKPINITVRFNYIGKKEQWHEIWNKAKKWLSAKNSRLILGDDPGHFYKVYYVTVSENERKSRRIGYFTAVFHCGPYRYINAGETETSLDFENYFIADSDGNPILDSEGNNILTTEQWAEIENPYEACEPVYIIKGSGKSEMKVNKSLFLADVNGKITIDCKREVSYKADMTSANTDVTGDYAKLKLKEGTNLIEKSEFFSLSLIPNWREL